MTLFIFIGMAAIISALAYLSWRKDVMKEPVKNAFWWKVALGFAYFALFGALVGVLKN